MLADYPISSLGNRMIGWHRTLVHFDMLEDIRPTFDRRSGKFVPNAAQFVFEIRLFTLGFWNYGR